MMHGVNAQHSDKMCLGTSASPQTQRVELEGSIHWVSHPLTLYCLSLFLQLLCFPRWD